MSHPARHLQQSPSRSRLLAWPFVALCLAVYLSSAAHFALVQHGTCFEHGEVIHLGLDDLREQSQPTQVVSSFADERIARAGQEFTGAHGPEDHCPHAFLRREGLIPAVWHLRTPEVASELGVAPARYQLPPEPVARLRLAPKSSPPLA